jgi:hypothetical protein
MTSLFDSHAVLLRELGIRLINVSAGGCLIESDRSVEVGTVGTLHVRLGTEECKDDVEVVRCEAIRGAKTVYHVALRMLRTKPRQAGSIRHAVARHQRAFERWQSGRVM